MQPGDITLRDVYRARRTIAPYVRRTPLARSASLSEKTGAEVRLKLECLQDTGAFKLRGATNRLMHLSDAERARGVIAVSTGNHGRGVSAAAHRLGIRAVICMSDLVPDNKVQAIRDLGADVRIVGNSQDDAEVEARRLVDEEGLVWVSPFDDPFVIAGQGTIGLELLEDMPDIDTAIVPLSGGGLIGGIALALKSATRDIRVIGVTMENGAAMYESQRAGKPVPVDEEPSLADCLTGSLGLENHYTFDLVRDHVDDMLLVSEEQIADAVRHAYRQERLIVEGGASVGIAALLNGLAGDIGTKVAVVISGGNIDMDKFDKIVGA